jgi:predicted O-methyltransferase YrrM
MELPIDIDAVKGFMPQDEGLALGRAAAAAPTGLPALEVGSYCGKSAVYIGTALKAGGGTLFTLDHHRGSEENQPGWEHHDTSTWDTEARAMDTLPFLRRTLRAAELEDVVIPIIGTSEHLARYWQTPLGFLFIDGGHSIEPALADYRSWTPFIKPGGTLAIHDVFESSADGGQAPFEIFKMALGSALFEETDRIGSLRLLRRL